MKGPRSLTWRPRRTVRTTLPQQQRQPSFPCFQGQPFFWGDPRSECISPPLNQSNARSLTSIKGIYLSHDSHRFPAYDFQGMPLYFSSHFGHLARLARCQNHSKPASDGKAGHTLFFSPCALICSFPLPLEDISAAMVVGDVGAASCPQFLGVCRDFQAQLQEGGAAALVGEAACRIFRRVTCLSASGLVRHTRGVAYVVRGYHLRAPTVGNGDAMRCVEFWERTNSRAEWKGHHTSAVNWCVRGPSVLAAVQCAAFSRFARKGDRRNRTKE